MVFPSQWCKIGLALPLPPAFSGLFPGSGRLKPLIFDLRGEPVPEEFRLSGGFSTRATQGESTVVSTPHTVNEHLRLQYCSSDNHLCKKQAWQHTWQRAHATTRHTAKPQTSLARTSLT
jgi:hypothetical protein